MAEITPQRRPAVYRDMANMHTRLALAHFRMSGMIHPKNPARELRLQLARGYAREARWWIESARIARVAAARGR